MKLNTIRSEIRNKKVLLVDDSIVRGNTSREIIQLVRNAGAKQVYYALFSPPLKYPCVYGIDMQTKGEFIARDRSINDIKNSIKADALIYQTVPGMVKAVGGGDKNYCTACFSGKYPTAIPENLMKKIEMDRSIKKEIAEDII
jgi:amidophosphoribosyltransferase